MPWVVANNHDNAMATNHLALVTDFLDTGLDLHGFTSAAKPRSRLFVAVNDTATGKVVRGHFYYNRVLGEDADVVLTHLAGNVSQHDVVIF